VGAEQPFHGFRERCVGLVAGQVRAELGGHRLGQVPPGDVQAGRGSVREQPRSTSCVRAARAARSSS
jgi:hypothetical protein